MASLILLSSKPGPAPSLLDTIASLGKGTIAFYVECNGTANWGVIEHGNPLDYLGYATRCTMLLTVTDWTCTHSISTVGGHALAWVTACAAHIPRQLYMTTSLPSTLRKSSLAALTGYVLRMLSEGSRTERIAARLVLLGARASLLHILSLAPRKTPVGIMAAERLCVTHHGRWAAIATHTLPRCTLLEKRVVTLKLQAGLPRMTIEEVDAYRR